MLVISERVDEIFQDRLAALREDERLTH